MDIPVWVVTSAKRSVEDIQVKRWVQDVPVKYKPGPWKTLKETYAAVRGVIGSSEDLQDPTDDVPAVEDAIIEEDALWDLIF